MIDRDRLKQLQDQATDVLTQLTSQVIESRLQSLPANLRPLARLMAGPLQIRSTISAALTRIELSDDEWRSLLQLVTSEINLVLPGQGEDDVIRALKKTSHEAAQLNAAPAVEHLRRLLSE